MYDVSDFTFHRLLLSLFDYNKKSVKVSVGTWWDSAIYGVGLNYLLYKPDLTVNPKIPGCVEVYSECHYTGDSVTVCDKVLSLPEAGWNKPVKSFVVPEKKVLKVYNKENLNGQSLRFDKSEECLENPRFTLMDLLEVGH